MKVLTQLNEAVILFPDHRRLAPSDTTAHQCINACSGVIEAGGSDLSKFSNRRQLHMLFSTILLKADRGDNMTRQIHGSSSVIKTRCAEGSNTRPKYSGIQVSFVLSS